MIAKHSLTGALRHVPILRMLDGGNFNRETVEEWYESGK